MGEIFRSFIAGREAGEDRRQRQTQRTALDEAGQLYGLGKTDAAENSLVAAGMPDVAANYSALGEARRARQGRERATQAAQALGPDATPIARTSAMADAYLEFGDPEQARALQEYSNSIDDRQRQNDLQRLGFVGSIQASLLDVPMEQRVARARELIAQSPYANDEHMQALLDDDASDLSDEALSAGARATMGAEAIISGRERQQRYAVDDSHWGAEFGQRERSINRRDQMDTIEGRADYNRLSQYQNAAVTASSESLPQLYAVRDAIMAAASRMGQPLNAETNIRLQRLFGNDTEGRAALELLRARTIPAAVAATRGLQPVSRFEFEQALSSVANADMTAYAAMQRINDSIAAAERVVQIGDLAEREWHESGSLTNGFLERVGTEMRTTPAPEIRGRHSGRPPESSNGAWRQGQPIPQEAISILRQNPSRERRAAFDRSFGAGASANALGERDLPGFGNNLGPRM